MTTLANRVLGTAHIHFDLAKVNFHEPARLLPHPTTTQIASEGTRKVCSHCIRTLHCLDTAGIAISTSPQPPHTPTTASPPASAPADRTAYNDTSLTERRGCSGGLSRCGGVLYSPQGTTANLIVDSSLLTYRNHGVSRLPPLYMSPSLTLRSISRDSRHKRSASGAKRAYYRKKRYA